MAPKWAPSTTTNSYIRRLKRPNSLLKSNWRSSWLPMTTKWRWQVSTSFTNSSPSNIKSLFLINSYSLINKPHDEKTRTLKKTNVHIQGKLLSLKPPGAVHKLIEALGYVEMDEEFYIFVGDFFRHIVLGQGIIDHTLTKIKMKYASEEEKKRYELIEQKRQEALEEVKRKQDIMKKLQADSESDRREKAKEKAKTSVANQLNFGANVKKFEPPANQGG